MKDDALDVFTLIKSLEALSISYSGPHLLTKSVIRLIGKQVQAVNTCVCYWQGVGAAPLLDDEQLRSIATVDMLEAAHRDAQRPRHKL